MGLGDSVDNLYPVYSDALTRKLWVAAAAQPKEKFESLIRQGDLSKAQPAVVVFHGHSCTVVVRPPTSSEVRHFLEHWIGHEVVNVGLIADAPMVRKALYDNEIRPNQPVGAQGRREKTNDASMQ
jgi:hypothetical protein